jgi:hypothetical protein
VFRRILVKVVVFGGLTGLAGLPARAQQKFSKTAADYQDAPKDGLLTCAACSLFRPPRSCTAVEGDISPNGWCKFFDLPD